LREIEQRSGAEWHRLGLEWMATYGLGEYIAQADLPIMQCPLHLQRAVLILAQALLKPNILLIDEPTFSLAEENAALLVDWLKQLSTHCKLCVTLHNQKQARNLADRIVLIGGGRVLAHQETSLFFKQPANEWVENFIRTGSLPLPSPDAREQDLESDAVAPPLLSEAAQLAVQDHTASQPVSIASEPTAAPAYKSTNVPTQINQVSASSKAGPASEKPAATIRNPVELPMTSQNGVELASGIGEIIFRDSSAPRGFHWIVPGKLAGCPAPGVSAAIAYDLALLEKAGITMLVTLTETDLDQTVLAKYHLRNMHLPIYDRESPSVAQTHMLLVRMQRAIEQGEVLAVHCKAGLGRTGTILAAWMIREGGLSARGAMERLRRIEPGYIQSEVQENFLKYYEEDINRRLI
jgi:atypical dual specificity phosphatase